MVIIIQKNQKTAETASQLLGFLQKLISFSEILKLYYLKQIIKTNNELCKIKDTCRTINICSR